MSSDPHAEKNPDVLNFPEKFIIVLEACGSSGLAKVLLSDLVQHFTDFGATCVSRFLHFN